MNTVPSLAAVAHLRRAAPPRAASGLTSVFEFPPPTFEALLLSRLQAQLLDNDRALGLAIASGSGELRARVEAFCAEKLTPAERARDSPEVVWRKLAEGDPGYRALFRKTITRQSVHEKAQVDWIVSHKYPDAVKLPSNINGICFSKSKLHNITGVHLRPTDATKTFDLHSPSHGVLGVLKFTEGGGGSQDNQFRDVKAFVVEAVQFFLLRRSEGGGEGGGGGGEGGGASDMELFGVERFEFYLDGDYYTQRRRGELREMVPAELRSVIRITSCGDIIVL